MDPEMCAWSEDSDYNGSVLDDKTLKHARKHSRPFIISLLYVHRALFLAGQITV